MRKRLGRILLDRRLICSSDLMRALKIQRQQGGVIGEILRNLGVSQCCIDHALMDQLIDANAPTEEAQA